MKYYKYPDNYGPLGEAITYVEVKDGATIRQLTSSIQGYHGSNVKYHTWGLILVDQKVDYESIEKVTQISKDEFDEIWEQHLITHEATWVETKNNFPVGTKVVGLYCPDRTCHPDRWGPYGHIDSVIMPPIDRCESCHKTKCEHYNCMELISVDQVFNKVKEMIAT